MSKIADAGRKALEVQTVKLDDIVANYGGVVTINGLDYTSFKGNPVPVFKFVEGEGAVFRGTCTKLKELADSLKEMYGGNLQAINDDFKHTGIRIKIEPETKTSSGNKFRPISFIREVDFVDEPDCDDETGEVVNPEAPSVGEDPF